jgi:hypothetical protein
MGWIAPSSSQVITEKLLMIILPTVIQHQEEILGGEIMQIDDEKRIFVLVLMPFGPEFNNIYRDIIVPTLESEGCTVKRAVNLADQQNTLKDVVCDIEKADLVIAELTSLNSNVMYELGIAHALLKRTVLLAQAIKKIPFDLLSYRIIIYSNDNEIKVLQEELRKTIQKCKEGSTIFGNPVIDFVYMTSVHRIIDFNSIRREDIESIKDLKERTIDFLGNVAFSAEELSEHQQGLNELIKGFNRVFIKYNDEIKSYTDCIKKITSADVDNLFGNFASEVIAYSQDIETELGKLHASWEDYFESLTNLFYFVSIVNPEEKENILNAISKPADSMKQVRDNLCYLRKTRDAILKLEKVNKNYDHAVQQHVAAIDRCISEFTIMDSSLVRLGNLLNDMKE